LHQKYYQSYLIEEISLFKVDTTAESFVSKNLGTAKDAITPMITIAKINSKREKPFFIINPLK
jgi:hypothetical protein